MNEVSKQEPSNIILDSSAMSNMVKFSEIMAKSNITVPSWLRGNMGDCLAICMQACRWGGMDPFMVASKTYTIPGSGKLSYESQLVAAVINSSAKIDGRLHYEYGGNWDALDGYEPVKKKGKNDKWFHTKGWPDSAEKGLWCRAGATIAGESGIEWGEKIYLPSIITRNSTNWVNAAKQQIAYTASQRWCRLYAPEVILGIYTSDELPDSSQGEKNITPPKTAIRRPQNVVENVEKELVIEPVVEPDDLIPLDELGALMLAADNIDSLDAVRHDVQQHDYESNKQQINDIIEIYKTRKAEMLRAIDEANLNNNK